MVLYKAYSLIPSSRLTLPHEEEDIRIDWVCYLRDHNLPCNKFIKNFEELRRSAEENHDPGYLRWLQQRTNNLLESEEVEELKEYLSEKYGLPVYIENVPLPIDVNNLPWFKEDYVNSMVILSGRDDPFTLSCCIVGMVAPFKNISSVDTVKQFLAEVDRQRSSKNYPGDLV
ncbi:MAG: hypothetical protein G3M70_11955 [Candidatus Nitronauta litoralis]|uniref:Uncharacterized protein n=1 Tax=Candidatus Nitronauta litoralis TaxID=2705533 RepID=A0A7T0BX43_9BACT|nr:MAG: hypothetical protein G3M70_11955 [Candidatus Nitronauta litoralis]